MELVGGENMNTSWLLENADIPIRYILDKEKRDIEELFLNDEVSSWISRIAERSEANNIGDIHGSHDYRMENILGKCWILGLSKQSDRFAEHITFILKYIERQIQSAPVNESGFGRLYHYRDCQKVLCSFLPLLGFCDEHAVKYITNQRINILYEFTRQMRYDIYIDGSILKSVKKDWQPYIINPDLYADGNISLPDMHDLLLFAGMYPYLPEEDRNKVETIVQWFFGNGYSSIIRRYGYFYAPGGSYSTKAIIFKLHLLDFQNGRDDKFEKGALVSLLFNVFVLSHFKSARESLWFTLALDYLEQYKCSSGHYRFPSYMITEKRDSYVIMGGHMNVGENRKKKLYNEIISTYWMKRIYQNINI